jgi:uncharacterized protein YeeX (DUF496 family)
METVVVQLKRRVCALEEDTENQHTSSNHAYREIDRIMTDLNDDLSTQINALLADNANLQQQITMISDELAELKAMTGLRTGQTNQNALNK